LLFWNDTKLSSFVVEIWAFLSIICRKISITLSWINQEENQTSNHAFIRDAYSAYDSAERRIMIHEKIASKNKQLVELIESESFNAEQEFSKTKNIRRVSIISIEIFDDAFKDAKIFYHIRNMNQLRY
jgi:hypothetical protein